MTVEFKASPGVSLQLVREAVMLRLRNSSLLKLDKITSYSLLCGRVSFSYEGKMSYHFVIEASLPALETLHPPGETRFGLWPQTYTL